MIYWSLFFGFLRVGLFSFGGAYGAIPMIRDIVMEYGWLTEERFSDLIAVSESTPGPIMLNLATYVGQLQGGIWGAVLSTAAVVLPSFLIVLLITASMKSVLRNPWFQAVLRGLKPCIIGIVLATGLTMILSNCVDSGAARSLDVRSLGITVLLIAAAAGSRVVLHKKLSPVVLILLAGVLGILV